MVQDSAGFQSQQFGEQVAQRRDRYAAQNADSVGMLSKLVPLFQQARGASDEHAWGNQDRQFREQQAVVQAQQFEQERQIKASRAASDLASDQLHRQQAQEDLQWAQQLHQTDMIGLQKRGMAAEIELKEAQTKKMIDDLGSERVPASMVFDQERMDYAISELGIMADPKDRKTRAATPEERSAASERRKAWLQQEQNFKLEQIKLRNQGRPGTSDALETQRDVSATGKRLEQLLEFIAQRETDARNKRTPPDERAMIEQELIGLRRTAKQLGDKMDQALLGGERPASQQPKQSVEAEDPSVQQAMVNELDALHKTLDSVLGGPK